MPDGWSNLEEKLKKIQEKQMESDSGKPAEATVNEETKSAHKEKKKGAYSAYMEKVKDTYKRASPETKSGAKDKYEGMFEKFDVPKLHKPMAEQRNTAGEGKKQFKGMEKRFLKSRKF